MSHTSSPPRDKRPQSQESVLSGFSRRCVNNVKCTASYTRPSIINLAIRFQRLSQSVYQFVQSVRQALLLLQLTFFSRPCHPDFSLPA